MASPQIAVTVRAGIVQRNFFTLCIYAAPRQRLEVLLKLPAWRSTIDKCLCNAPG